MSYPIPPEGGGYRGASGGETGPGAPMRPGTHPGMPPELADADYSPDYAADDRLAGGAPMARGVQWAGAAVSLALVLGVVVWGYKLAVRDVSGVPVIRALEGPARVAPENPGGDLADHVGLAVNEVAGSGLAAPGPERVVLAPPPEDLAAGDAPMASLRPLPDLPAGDTAPGAAPAAAVPAAPLALPVPDAALPTTPAPTDTAAPAEPAAEVPAQTPAEPPAEAAEPPAEQAVPEGAIPASVPGLARSPRPWPRPARDLEAEAAAQAVAEAIAGPGAIDIDPASLPEGTRVVQLGAFDSAEIARSEWDRISAQFGALMEGKKRIVQEAVSGGRSFWRLRVHGFENVEEARRFCAALVAEGANCIPTLAK